MFLYDAEPDEKKHSRSREEKKNKAGRFRMQVFYYLLLQCYSLQS